MMIKIKFLLVTLLICSILRASDTLYFRLSNPWNTEKSIDGNYLRKCIKESDHFHTWDYNYKNILIAESFYTDTNFTTKVLCHKYFNEEKGVL
ncbi:hypothetical protein ACFOW1_05355 [Parasediminibacterium paludis]|uniref:Uncharacterized protein n=1 Tax=Parasediminibacterium paludis TaxID=908966 RepID=A0ABV8PVF3_9BACT